MTLEPKLLAVRAMGNVAAAASGPNDWRLRDEAAGLARFARFAAEHDLWMKRD